MTLAFSLIMLGAARVSVPLSSFISTTAMIHGFLLQFAILGVHLSALDICAACAILASTAVYLACTARPEAEQPPPISEIEVLQ